MKPNRKLNVIIVDDSTTILRIATHTLQSRFGDALEITALSDPNELESLLQNYCCDILLSDVEMPGINGMEVVRMVKRRNVWTQAIIMTAHSTCERLSAAMDCGACDYVVKPLDPDQLVEIFSECIRRGQRWRKALRGTLRPASVG
jgi:DNA-binding NtrC family response regulator